MKRSRIVALCWSVVVVYNGNCWLKVLSQVIGVPLITEGARKSEGNGVPLIAEGTRVSVPTHC